MSACAEMPAGRYAVSAEHSAQPRLRRGVRPSRNSVPWSARTWRGPVTGSILRGRPVMTQSGNVVGPTRARPPRSRTTGITRSAVQADEPW